MEIDYSFPGPIKIELDAADLSDIRSKGYCMNRNGFRSIESKTWVHSDPERRGPSASIDGDGDLNVWIPQDSVTPVVIEQDNVHSGNDARTDDIVEHFLADGSIVVSWSH
jgi:hypothetical protein